MCGIVGCVGKIWSAEGQAFKLLLQLDTIRGPHSTGVMSVSTKNKDDSTWLKTVGTPWELFECKDWSEFFNRRSHRVLLGHNRYATIGKITSDNAHPFEHGTFTGVHNGTIRNQYNLKDHKDHDVDSSNIYYNMAHEGVEATLKKLNGPFALVWYNSENGQLQMVRNSERPLFVCKSEDGKTYFWASEPWMLKVALGKHNIKMAEDPVEVGAGKLVTFDVPFSFEASKDFKPSVKEVEFYKYEAPKREESPYGYGNHNYTSRSSSNNQNTGGGRSNVLPFVRNQVSINSLKQYLGKTVVFSVVGERSNKNQDYIVCQVEDYLEPELRIFTPSKKKLGKLLLSSDLMFRGKVKACSADPKHGTYLTVDHRTIEEVIQDEMPLLLEHKDHDGNKEIVEQIVAEQFVPGFRGLMIPMDQWFKNTEAGCSWCKDFPKISEAEDLMWLKSDEFLCPLCQVDDDVLAMINLPSR